MALDGNDKQWIRQQLERMETTLLTEFHKWASPVESRQRSFREQLNAIDMELDAVKDRVKKLEQK